jgi:hypothetical protein
LIRIYAVIGLEVMLLVFHLGKLIKKPQRRREHRESFSAEALTTKVEKVKNEKFVVSALALKLLTLG